MAQDSLKDYTIQWVLFGLLFFSLLSFAILFTTNNNADAMGDEMQEVFNTSLNDMGTKLQVLPDDGNIVLNTTSKTNPEESYLGSQDTVSTGYKYHGTAKGFFQSTVSFFRLMFGGTAGEVILAVVGGLIGFLAVYLIYKWIKAGY